MTPRNWLVAIALSIAVACSSGVGEGAAETVYTADDVAAAPENWRQVQPENLVIMETTKGRIVVELLPEVAPNHVEQFRKYVSAELYDGTEFHRVIRDFMAQGGDVAAAHGEDKMLETMEAEFIFRRDPAKVPLDTIGPADSAGAGFYKGFPINTQPTFLADMSVDGLVESWIPHCPGVLSTARTDDPNSANAQFFLISKDGQHLDRLYTAKGRVLEGLDVVKSIKLGPMPNGYPINNPDVLVSARLVSDLPEAGRIQAFVLRTDTPEWVEKRTAADRTRAKICSLPPVPAVIVE